MINTEFFWKICIHMHIFCTFNSIAKPGHFFQNEFTPKSLVRVQNSLILLAIHSVNCFVGDLEQNNKHDRVFSLFQGCYLRMYCCTGICYN